MVEKKPINVEAQRIARMCDEYTEKMKILSILNADLFVEVRRRTEDELRHTFGREVGQLLYDEALCEDNFQSKNIKMTQQMEPLDSENFDAREKREARINANCIRTQTIKLVRIFSKKSMQDKLNKEFPNMPKQNEIANYAEQFGHMREIYQTRLRTPVEEANKIKQETETFQKNIEAKESTLVRKTDIYKKAKEHNRDQKDALKREKDMLEEAQTAKNSAKRTKEGDLKQLAERIRDEQKAAHEFRMTELAAQILSLEETLNNDKIDHNKREDDMKKEFDQMDNQYFNTLEQYDNDMREKNMNIDTNNKGLDEYSTQLNGLSEEYKQRLDEKRKRDIIKGMVDGLEDERNKKLEQEDRAAEWIQAHWLGMIERRLAKKGKGKKGRKGKKKK